MTTSFVFTGVQIQNQQFFLTLTVCTEKGALKQPKVAENQ